MGKGKRMRMRVTENKSFGALRGGLRKGGGKSGCRAWIPGSESFGLYTGTIGVRGSQVILTHCVVRCPQSLGIQP